MRKIIIVHLIFERCLSQFESFVSCALLLFFRGGKKLNFVMRTMEHNISMKTQFNQERLLSHALPLYRTTMSLIGRNVGINTAYGKCLVDEMTESETATIKHDPVQFKIVLFNKMYIAFIFRRFDTMKEFANIFFTEKVASFYIFFMVNTMNTFFGGLCSFWIARRTRESAWFERGEKALSQLKDWAESSKVC